MSGSRLSLGPWKPDDSVTVCDRCTLPFSLLRRRHHCRCCGCIFCEGCCHDRLLIAEVNPSTPQRVCTDCFLLLRQRPANPPRQVVGSQPLSRSVGSAVQPTCVESSRTPAVLQQPVPPTLPVLDYPDFESPLFFGDKNAATGSSHDSDSPTECDTENDEEGEASTAVAGVLSSMDDRRTNSISFLPVLHDNLVRSDARNVLSVLLFPSERCYSVNVVTVEPQETMQQLIERLVEPFFKLANGPFRPLIDEERESLIKQLHFSTEMHLIDGAVNAVEVASQSKRVVLSTLGLSKLEAVSHSIQSAPPSLREFFRTDVERRGRQSPFD